MVRDKPEENTNKMSDIAKTNSMPFRVKEGCSDDDVGIPHGPPPSSDARAIKGCLSSIFAFTGGGGNAKAFTERDIMRARCGLRSVYALRAHITLILLIQIHQP